ncbi:MAG: lysophospholipid acyltransferase family protein [Thermodesulfobacteriota bacterium]
MAWGLWFHFWLLVITMLAGTSAIFVSYFRRDFIQPIARWWARTLLYFGGITVQVQGLEHLTPGQTYVFAANHRSQFDIFVLLAVLPGNFLWVAKKSLFRIPVFGQALTRMGSIAIDRENLSEAIRGLNQATRTVQAGTSMIIFPEGTRANSRELLPFKKGVFIMALKARQPVVPVSINGTLAIQPRATLRLRPGPVQVVISPPINPRDYSLKRKEELMNAVRQAIADHYDYDFPGEKLS